MRTLLYTQYDQLEKSDQFVPFQQFACQAPNANFFQSPEFLKFIEPVRGYKPFLLVALSDSGALNGSLLGVIQSDGGGVKSWLSRRLIVWGGPVVAASADKNAVTKTLLQAMKKYAQGSAIFIEFRNFFDCSELHDAFAACNFHFRPHLNYLVKIDEDAAGRLSSNRRRQIKASLAAGAVVTEPESEADVVAFYELLKKLYTEKVKNRCQASNCSCNSGNRPRLKHF
ncbi:MAG: hypothetical protein IPH12_12780 [Saprospirales bacterium]|nr:hypothetical protein [Saprospirales bacterium]